MKEFQIKLLNKLNEKSIIKNYDYTINVPLDKIKWRTKVDCQCKTCGHEWTATLESLTNLGTGCMECNPKKKLDADKRTKEILERAEKDNLELIDFEGYHSQVQEIKYKCKTCGTESKTIAQLFTKNKKCNCPICSNKQKSEVTITKYFEDNNIKVIRKYKTIDNPDSNNKRKLEVDIYLPDYNIAIEVNDKGSHSSMAHRSVKLKSFFKTVDEYHEYKTKECLKQGIYLIHLDEEEYKLNADKVMEEILEVIKSK